MLALPLNLAPALLGGTPTVLAQDESACDSQSPGGDFRTFTCPLSVTGGNWRFHFRATFSGGHDDTKASMTLTLDGAPLTCDVGSKTSLFGEDGDIGLECRFSVTEKAAATQALRVDLRWSHAQYTGFELVPD